MRGWIDIHCHALPGVDDGADSVDTALQMLEEATREGLRQVILTPHLRVQDELPRLRLFERTFADLSHAVAAAGLPVDLRLGAEIAFRFGLDQVAADSASRLAGGPYVLVDLPPGPLSPGLEQAFFDLRTRGWYPILAHPERHRQLVRSPERLQRLREQDLLIQVDAGSLCGRFGRRTLAMARLLVERGWADFVASDGHDLRRRPLSVAAAAIRLEELVGTSLAHRLTVENPARVWAGEPVEHRTTGASPCRRTGFGRWIQEHFSSPAAGRG